MKKFMRMVGCLIVLLGLLANVGFATEMKKVMILYIELAKPAEVSQVLKGLEEAGFVEHENLTLIQVEVSGASDPAHVRAQVQDAAPDVVVNLHPFGQLVAALKGTSIPVIAAMGIEDYVNAEGSPTANVTGIYSTLPDMVYNSYKFLQKVAPLKPGQQAVFLDMPKVPIIPKAAVVDALQRLQIPLKAVVDATVYEDWQQAILQYNDDPEVGWILYGVGPEKKRDGSPVDPFTRSFFGTEST